MYSFPDELSPSGYGLLNLAAISTFLCDELMVDEITPLQWEQLTNQEQLVWAAAFARTSEFP